MKKSCLVRIIKRGEVQSPVVRAANWSTYVPGSWENRMSLPVDYEMVGYLLEDIIAGSKVRLLRVERNGQTAVGVYISSLVTEVDVVGYATLNSRYSVECLEQPQTLL